MLDLLQASKNKKTLGDSRLYTLAVALAVVATLLVAGIALLAGGSTVDWTTWLLVSISLLTFAFTVWETFPRSQEKLSNRNWLVVAGILSLLVYGASFFTGEYLNILLVPLVVIAGQRQKDGRFIIYASLAAAVLLLLEYIILVIIGWGGSLSENQSGVAVIIGISGVGLALATFIRKYLQEVESYRQEAATKASEMEVAHEIQTSLMPPSEIETGTWCMSARSIPALDVGGDFYEYIPYLDKGIGGIAIGDVAGKGIPAALQMAVVRTVFRIEARRRIFPAETLMSVNLALQAERSFGMVTMLYAFVDPTTSTLHVANAGHNFPIILNGKLEEVRLPGLPLGIDDSVIYDERQMKIAPSTSVIFYTDGVIEAMDANGEMYGFENFRNAVIRHQHLEAREMVDEIFKEISTFTQGAPQSDDITVVVLQNRRVESEADEYEYDREVAQMFASVNADAEGEEEEVLDGFEEASTNWI